MHDEHAARFKQTQRALADGDVDTVARLLYEQAARRAKHRAAAVKLLRRVTRGSPAR